MAPAAVRDDRLGQMQKPGFGTDAPIRVVTGHQDQHIFADAANRSMLDTFEASQAEDRMGMQLSGPAMVMKAAVTIPDQSPNACLPELPCLDFMQGSGGLGDSSTGADQAGPQI